MGFKVEIGMGQNVKKLMLIYTKTHILCIVL